MNWLKYCYRRWTKRCLSCGDKLKSPKPDCYHCMSDLTRCHACNKLNNHAKNYGYYAKPHGSGYIEVIK